jgi:hypothetical protein
MDEKLVKNQNNIKIQTTNVEKNNDDNQINSQEYGDFDGGLYRAYCNSFDNITDRLFFNFKLDQKKNNFDLTQQDIFQYPNKITDPQKQIIDVNDDQLNFKKQNIDYYYYHINEMKREWLNSQNKNNYQSCNITSLIREEKE